MRSFGRQNRWKISSFRKPEIEPNIYEKDIISVKKMDFGTILEEWEQMQKQPCKKNKNNTGNKKANAPSLIAKYEEYEKKLLVLIIKKV